MDCPLTCVFSGTETGLLAGLADSGYLWTGIERFVGGAWFGVVVDHPGDLRCHRTLVGKQRAKLHMTSFAHRDVFVGVAFFGRADVAS